VCLVAAQYSQVKKLVTDYLQTFSNDDQQDVMGGNAVKFYHLY
jgi:L-fuconolactonase